MKGKILIVEDEPIVALDLHQEITQMGCEVVGVAESADEALLAIRTCRPDLALMDIRIVGNIDGIQTARLLSSLYGTPSIFLTSYSDEITISRAARAMPYGYLTKPFQSGELKATMQVALHKAKLDGRQKAAHHACQRSRRKPVGLWALRQTVPQMRRAHSPAVTRVRCAGYVLVPVLPAHGECAVV